jgi:hypothetical protein
LQNISGEIINDFSNLQNLNSKFLTDLASSREDLLKNFDTINEEKIGKISENQNKIKQLEEEVTLIKGEEYKNIQNDLKRYDKLIKKRYNTFQSSLETQTNEFLIEIDKELTSATEHAQNTLEIDYNEYTKNLEENQKRSAITIDKSKNHLEETIERVNETVSQSLNEVLKILTKSFVTIKEDLSNDLMEHQQQFNKSCEDLVISYNNLTNDYRQKSEKYIQATATEVKETNQNYLSRISENSKENKNKLNEIIESNIENANITQNKMLSDIETYLTTITNKISTVTESINNDLLSTSDTLDEVLEKSKQISSDQLESVETVSLDLENTIIKSIESFENNIKSVSRELGLVATNNTTTLNDQIQEVTKSINTLLSDLVENTKGSLKSLDEDSLSAINNLRKEAEVRFTTEVENLEKIHDKAKNSQTHNLADLIAKYNQGRKLVQDNVFTLSTEMFDQLISNIEPIQNSTNELYSSLLVLVPEELNKFRESILELLNELGMTLESNQISKLREISESLDKIVSNKINETEGEHSEQLNIIREEFTQNLLDLHEEAKDNVKRTVQEILDHIAQRIESFQDRIVKKETEDVKNLRNTIQEQPLDVIGQIASDQITGAINPYQESVINEFDLFRDNLEEFLGNIFSNSMKKYAKNLLITLQSLREAIIAVPQNSVDKLNELHKTFAGLTSKFQEEITPVLSETLETNFTQGKDIILKGKNNLLTYEEKMQSNLTSLLEEVNSQIKTMQDQFSITSQDYQMIQNEIQKIISEENIKGSLIHKVRRILSPDDATRSLAEVMDKCKKKLIIIVPDSNQLPLETIMSIPSRARVKIITNVEPQDDKWINSIYKKKGNIQIYASKKKMNNIIICNRDNNEILLYATPDEDDGNPGFIITNTVLANLFDKAILSVIIQDAKRIARRGRV